MQRAATAIVWNLVGMPDAYREDELTKLKRSNLVVYRLVCTKLQRLHHQADQEGGSSRGKGFTPGSTEGGH